MGAHDHVTQTDRTDPLGIVRGIAFNAMGATTTSDTQAFEMPDAQTTSYARDATTNVVQSITDALGRRTDIASDPVVFTPRAA